MNRTRAPREAADRRPARAPAQPLGLGGDGLSGQLSRHECSVYTIERRGHLREDELGNGVRVVTAPMPQVGSVSCFVMLAAGSRYETPTSKGIAHFAEHMFFKGTERRPTARTISTEIDAIGGEFNAFTGKELTGYYVRAAPRRATSPSTSSPTCSSISRFDGGDREGEGRDPRGDERLPRHAAALRRERLRPPALRGPAARLGHPRHTGDGRGATRETFTSYLDAWYRPSGSSSASAGESATVSPSASRSSSAASSRGRRAGRGRRAPTDGSPVAPAHEGVRAGAPHPRRPRVPDRPSRTATRSSSSPSYSEAACRRACSPRCARSAGSRTTSTRGTRRTRTRDVLHERRRGRRRVDEAIATILDELGRSPPSRSRGRAREGARLREGPVRPPAREPAGDDPVRPPARGARGRDRGARRAPRRDSTR